MCLKLNADRDLLACYAGAAGTVRNGVYRMYVRSATGESTYRTIHRQERACQTAAGIVQRARRIHDMDMDQDQHQDHWGQAQHSVKHKRRNKLNSNAKRRGTMTRQYQNEHEDQHEPEKDTRTLLML